jgi:hypothetical protein
MTTVKHSYIIDGTLYKYENEKDRLRMGGGSWSINLDEIGDETVHNIRFKTAKAIYAIDFETANKRGWIMQFGNENKLIVPLRYWTIERENTITK